MAEDGESRKGQNLEMIVSKLAKEKPSNGLGNLILISGVNIQNLSLPTENEPEEEEPDLHQCGKCKHMFVSLEKYLKHRTGKLCQKKVSELQENSDDAGSPNNIPEVVQMEATGNTFHEYENGHPEFCNKRRHDRKGVARKRTNGIPSDRTVATTTDLVSTNHARMDRLQEIIHPEYTTSAPPPYLAMVGPQRSYIRDTALPNNNDLYALMELTKNSGIKESEEHHNDTGQHHELINGEVLPTFYPLSTMHSPNHPRGPLVAHNPISASMTTGTPVLFPYHGVETADISPKGAKRRYKCEKCDREFNQRANLRRHQLVHSGEKPFECPQCQRRFQQQGDLKRHMLRHTEVSNYYCQICDKKFMRLDRWRIHMKTHVENGDLPEIPADISLQTEDANGITEGTEDDTMTAIVSHHNCSKCSQTFVEPDELLLHTCTDTSVHMATVTMETHTTDGVDTANIAMAEGIRRNAAADADHSRTYSSSRSASKGKLTNPHKCPLCNAYYKNVDSLKTHILKHSGEKKYKCDQCPKAFFTSSNLKIHKRIHSGDKPLKCKICFKAFSDPSNFNKHKKSHIKGGKAGEPRVSKRNKNAKVESIEDIKSEQGIEEEQVVKTEEPMVAQGDGSAMEFTSQTHDFVQTQYEAVFPALDDTTGEAEAKQADELTSTQNDDYHVPYVQSPSF